MRNSFDYLVVGGGSGGAVVAGRLREDPGTSVCLLEAGGDGADAINAMVYTRGHRSDYDGWAAMGATGWSWDEVPYFRLSEHNERIQNALHGQDGPLWVSDPRSDNPLHARFAAAAREAGFPVSDDFNGAEQEGLGIYPLTQKHGERWSAARAYLLPHIGRRDNLKVETRAHVRLVPFEGSRAVGVEFLQGGEVRTLRARREVVLCAGAF
jgi:choline dehydrogenase-like flavoprotein